MARIFKDYPAVSINLNDLDGKINFLSIFGRPGPIHIEIGSGKGTFLLSQAKAHPEINFLGIEWANKYFRHAVDRIGRWALTNVRIIRADAADFLAELIPDASVQCFHIYFPDPWPKKRHNKRRFFNTENFEHLFRCLQLSGTIRIATDHADYFEQIETVLAGQQSRIEKIDFPPTVGAQQGEWVGTNFERKYLKEERPIYTIAVKKRT